MPAPKGNHNALGNPGGSRKSAYLEHQDAEWHSMIWKEAQDVPALEDKINSGNYSGREAVAFALLKGNNTVMAKFIDKLIPALPVHIDVTSGGENILVAGLSKEMEELRERYELELRAKILGKVPEMIEGTLIEM